MNSSLVSYTGHLSSETPAQTSPLQGTVLTYAYRIFVRNSLSEAWREIPVPPRFHFTDCSAGITYEVDSCKMCMRLVARGDKTFDCARTVVQCENVEPDAVLATVNVVGSNPHVLPLSEIPANHVVFNGSTALLTVPQKKCSVLLYETCYQNQRITVAVIFLREQIRPALLNLKVSASPVLLNLESEASGQVVSTNCVTNSGETTAVGVTVAGTVASSAAGVVVTSLQLPPDCFPVGVSGYGCVPFNLLPGETKCIQITAQVTCTEEGTLAAITNAATASSGVLASNASAFSLVQCATQCECACAYQACTADASCGGTFPCPPSTGTPFTVNPSQPVSATNYHTISSAVAAAPPNTPIIVSDGDYDEQVTIPSGKDNLTLSPVNAQGATIRSSTGGTIVIKVSGAKCTTIRDFVIRAPAVSGRVGTGILVIGGGSATIASNLITVTDPLIPINGNQAGTGINVEAASCATIIGNTVEEYQKTGIRVNGAGAYANVLNNTIRGVGPTPVIAQNGIQVSRGASAMAQGNDVSGNEYTGGNTVSCGILLFQCDTSTDVCVQFGNSGYNNDVGLALATCEGVLTQGNDFHDNVDYGIYVLSDSINNTFIRNTAFGNGVFDINDESTGFGSAMTANTYLCNECASDNKGGAICDSKSPVAVPTATLDELLAIFLPAPPPLLRSSRKAEIEAQ